MVLFLSAMLVIIQFALFLLVGLGLYAFYGTYNLAEMGISRGGGYR